MDITLLCRISICFNKVLFVSGEFLASVTSKTESSVIRVSVHIKKVLSLKEKLPKFFCKRFGVMFCRYRSYQCR